MPLPPEAKQRITAVILAGGRGRRLGGVDKGLLDLRGQALVQHVHARLAPQVGTVLINANRNLARYARLGFEVVGDEARDYPGPLAGIAAALNRCTTPYLLSVPCDTPCLPPDLAERLYLGLESEGADAVIARDLQRLHPVVALLRRRLLPSLEDYLRGGGHKVADWMRRQRHCEIDFSDQTAAFFNVNTPQDLERLRRGPCPPPLTDPPD